MEFLIYSKPFTMTYISCSELKKTHNFFASYLLCWSCHWWIISSACVKKKMPELLMAFLKDSTGCIQEAPRPTKGKQNPTRTAHCNTEKFKTLYIFSQTSLMISTKIHSKEWTSTWASSLSCLHPSSPSAGACMVPAGPVTACWSASSLAGRASEELKPE